MAVARKTRLDVRYNGKNLPGQLKKYIEELTYTDVASGESDSIDFTVNNRDLRFIGRNMPKKGDAVTVYIRRMNWNRSKDTRAFKCGKFVIDDISFSGPVNQGKISAVSIPVKEEFKSTRRSKTYKKQRARFGTITLCLQ